MARHPTQQLLCISQRGDHFTTKLSFLGLVKMHLAGGISRFYKSILCKSLDGSLTRSNLRSDQSIKTCFIFSSESQNSNRRAETTF